MPIVVPAEGPILERILDAIWQARAAGLSRQGYAKLHAAEMKTPWVRRHLRRFALMEGDTILAAATQYALAGALDRRPIRICGLGGVFVDSTTCDGDRAWGLIDRLLDRARDDGADFALLFSGDELDHCGQHGFETLAIPETQLHVAEPPRCGAPMTMIRSGEERDFQAIVAMGQVRARDIRLHLDRNVDLVHHAITRQRLLAGLGTPGARELHFFIAEEGITAAASVVVSVAGTNWTIEECGDRDPSGARVGAILQALIAREPAARRPSVRAWLPSAFVPPQVTITADASPTTTPRMRLKALGDAIAPALAREDVLYWRSDAL